MDVNELTEWRKRALPCAEQAVALDAMDGVSHRALAEVAFLLKQYDRSVSHITRAVALNPNDADVLVMSSCRFTQRAVIYSLGCGTWKWRWSAIHPTHRGIIGSGEACCIWLGDTTMLLLL